MSGNICGEPVSDLIEKVDVIDLNVTWSDAAKATRSYLLPNVNIYWTLSHLKKVCADALQVPSVRPQDFNEDMDSFSLLQLSIGTSDVPFAIDFDAEESYNPPTSQDSPKIPAKSVEATSSLADRQAWQDATEVLDGWLFLGGQTAAGSRKVLQDLKITHILNCCERVPNKFKKTFTYHTISVFDTKSADIRKHFKEALSFIDDAKAHGGGILVHCMVGASRSATFVLAWMVSRCRIPLKSAFAQLRQRRSVARPNRGFCLQLMDYEKEQLGTCSISLSEFGHE